MIVKPLFFWPNLFIPNQQTSADDCFVDFQRLGLPMRSFSSLEDFFSYFGFKDLKQAIDLEGGIYCKKTMLFLDVGFSFFANMSLYLFFCTKKHNLCFWRCFLFV